jgi:aspartate 1-decarboxylase
MLKSKIYGAVITDKQLFYDGSITLGEDLLEAAGILPGEQVHVLNLNNGARMVTYTIVAPAGSGTVMLNGPAARLGEVGDSIIVLTYGIYDDAEAARRAPVVVRLGEGNRLEAKG